MNTNQYNSITKQIIFIIAITFILYITKSLIIPLLLAIIIAIAVQPFQNILERKIKCNRLLSAISSVALIFFVSTITLLAFGNKLRLFLDNSELYASKVVEIYETTLSYLDEKFGINALYILQQESDNISLIKDVLKEISTLAIEWGTVLTDLVLIPIYVFFFLYYKRFFRGFFYRIFKNRSKSHVNIIINKICKVQQKYILGLFKVILIVGTLNSIGLLVLDIDDALFLGYFAAVLIIIPYVGVMIGALLPILVALATKDTYLYAVGVIAIFGFIQFLEGYVITPKIIGNEVSLNELMTILALLVFATLWGLPGMIVAIPITATIKIIFDNSNNYKAWGYLLSRPNNKILERKARTRLKAWKQIRKSK